MFAITVTNNRQIEARMTSVATLIKASMPSDVKGEIRRSERGRCFFSFAGTTVKIRCTAETHVSERYLT